MKEKRQTASEVKINIANALERTLKALGTVGYNKFVGEMALQTGYSKKFVEEVIQMAEYSERIYITEDGFIKKAEYEKKVNYENNDDKIE